MGFPTANNKGLDAAGGKTALGLRQMPRGLMVATARHVGLVMSLDDSLRQASVEAVE